jgi:4-aminobutyrate aminotransferase
MLPRIITELPGPKTRAVIEKDRRCMSPSYTRDYSLVIEHGDGATVTDPDGNTFLDFSAGIAVCATGHSHPEVVKAIREQSEKFLHMSGTDFYYEIQVKVAEKLAGLAPIKGNKKVFFTNSGAEAVEAALKLARYHTGRTQLIAFLGAFHGRTMGALSLTASKVVQKRGFYPLVPGVVHVPYAYCYRCPYNLEYDSCGIACLKFLSDLVFAKAVDPQNVAAIFVEPIQGEGGYIVPPKEFLQGLRELCDKHGILLVADEVQSGMGRTGKMFASEHFDLMPDIICIAKGIASGLPLGAIIASEETMDWQYGSHASTFGGNPVCCAAALKTIDLVEGQLMANAARVGSHLKSRLQQLVEKYDCVGDVRGLGLMVGMEIIVDKKTKNPSPELRNKIVMGCFKRGLLILGCGANTVRFAPPLIITQEQADFAVDCIDSVIAEIATL